MAALSPCAIQNRMTRAHYVLLEGDERRIRQRFARLPDEQQAGAGHGLCCAMEFVERAEGL